MRLWGKLCVSLMRKTHVVLNLFFYFWCVESFPIEYCSFIKKLPVQKDRKTGTRDAERFTIKQNLALLYQSLIKRNDHRLANHADLIDLKFIYKYKLTRWIASALSPERKFISRKSTLQDFPVFTVQKYFLFGQMITASTGPFYLRRRKNLL